MSTGNVEDLWEVKISDQLSSDFDAGDVFEWFHAPLWLPVGFALPSVDLDIEFGLLPAALVIDGDVPQGYQDLTAVNSSNGSTNGSPLTGSGDNAGGQAFWLYIYDSTDSGDVGRSKRLAARQALLGSVVYGIPTPDPIDIWTIIDGVNSGMAISVVPTADPEPVSSNSGPSLIAAGNKPVNTIALHAQSGDVATSFEVFVTNVLGTESVLLQQLADIDLNIPYLHVGDFDTPTIVGTDLSVVAGGGDKLTVVSTAGGVYFVNVFVRIKRV